MLPFKPCAAAWRDLQREAKARVHSPATPVFAGDVSFRMTDFASRNAERAGVRQAIEFKTADALQRPPPAAVGTLIMNPPYGERIAPKGRGSVMARGTGNVTSREGFDGSGSSAEFFGGLASLWKKQYAGWTAWLLSPDMKLPSLMRLKESRRVPMWNGGIECRLFRFDMVAGAGPGSVATRVLEA
jgi:putative N6-adenine-specific DNA methylase